MAKKRNRMLEDGQVGRVRMTMRDSSTVHDAVFAGDSSENGLHRPGFRVSHNDSVAARVAASKKQVAHAQYKAELRDAWRDDTGINGVGFSHAARPAGE